MNIGNTKQKILILISKKPTYGYQISKELDISLSSIYGHLKYFREKELIIVEKVNSRRQKYYSLSQKGKNLLEIIS